MRIISGKAKGTKLYTLDGNEITRPTLDRVKESLFNIINEKIINSTVLDLFAGSGAIGLEFASRGAKKVILCDNNKKAIEIINKNTQKTHLQDFVQVYKSDFIDLITKMNQKFDIIYIDPPYKTNYIKKSIEKLIKSNSIHDKSLIIVETDEIDRILEDIKDLEIEKTDNRKYGRAHLIFFKIKKKG